MAEETREEGYRVSVCLQRYFSDERSRAYVNVAPRHSVCWLGQRLRTLFGLRGRFCLLSRGHLLPPEELLSLLQPDDPVEVIPVPDEDTQGEERNIIFNGAAAASLRPDIGTDVSPSPQRESPPTSTVMLDTEREDVLVRMKERALALLETCDDSPPVAAAAGGVGAGTPGRKRRRVRRRKRRMSSENVLVQEKVAAGHNENNRDGMAGPPPALLPASTTASAAAADVPPAARRARLVRSLSPPRS